MQINTDIRITKAAKGQDTGKKFENKDEESFF